MKEKMKAPQPYSTTEFTWLYSIYIVYSDKYSRSIYSDSDPNQIH